MRNVRPCGHVTSEEDTETRRVRMTRDGVIVWTRPGRRPLRRRRSGGRVRGSCGEDSRRGTRRRHAGVQEASKSKPWLEESRLSSHWAADSTREGMGGGGRSWLAHFTLGHPGSPDSDTLNTEGPEPDLWTGPQASPGATNQSSHRKQTKAQMKEIRGDQVFY